MTLYFEITIQVRVTDIVKGQEWYEKLLNKKPDYIPHEGFVEWELIPGSWLQVAEGVPGVGSGPLRLGVTNIEDERERMLKALNIESFAIHSGEGVPVRWGTFQDPWGNAIGFYEYIDKVFQAERLNELAKNITD